MGLRPHLRQLNRAHRSAPALPQPLQLPTTTRQPRPPTTGHETEQPRWELQLGLPQQIPGALGHVRLGPARGEESRPVTRLALAAGEVEVVLQLAPVRLETRLLQHEAVGLEEVPEIDVR